MAALAVVLLLVVLGAAAATALVRPAASRSAPPLASASLADLASPPSPTARTTPTPTATLRSPASQAVPTATANPSNGHEPGVPDRSLTPGAANPDVTPANIGKTICAKGWTATVRPPASYTTTLKRRQIAQYGYTDTALADYEEDHLISLELGGDPRDPANLWPEPYTATLPDGTKIGARVKDQLENRLNDMVCSGEMPLATAQHLIATDWIDAWRTYVAP
jgi:hypothetical protein